MDFIVTRKVEVRDSRTGYFIPARYGLGIWADGKNGRRAAAAVGVSWNSDPKCPKYDKIYLLNGLGTRGVLMAPLLSNWLFRFITNKEKLPPEADIKRFEKQYFSN